MSCHSSFKSPHHTAHIQRLINVDPATPRSRSLLSPTSSLLRSNCRGLASANSREFLECLSAASSTAPHHIVNTESNQPTGRLVCAISFVSVLKAAPRLRLRNKAESPNRSCAWLEHDPDIASSRCPHHCSSNAHWGLAQIEASLFALLLTALLPSREDDDDKEDKDVMVEEGFVIVSCFLRAASCFHGGFQPGADLLDVDCLLGLIQRSPIASILAADPNTEAPPAELNAGANDEAPRVLVPPTEAYVRGFCTEAGPVGLTAAVTGCR